MQRKRSPGRQSLLAKCLAYGPPPGDACADCEPAEHHYHLDLQFVRVILQISYQQTAGKQQNFNNMSTNNIILLISST